MRLKPWQDSVMARLNTVLPDHIPIKQGGYDEPDSTSKLSNGMIAPYVLVWFGGSIDPGPGYAGICGVRKNARLGLIHIECVGTLMQHAMDLGDEVRDALVGFVPTGGGELEEDGAPTIRNPISTTTGVDVRYSYPLAFTGTVNATTA